MKLEVGSSYSLSVSSHETIYWNGKRGHITKFHNSGTEQFYYPGSGVLEIRYEDINAPSIFYFVKKGPGTMNCSLYSFDTEFEKLQYITKYCK